MNLKLTNFGLHQISIKNWRIRLIILALQQGELIAYLTESIYEVGCDPDNESTEDKLLADNKRPGGKSLILVAKTYSQWLPATKHLHKWITGDNDLIAVRVSQHIVVSQLCELLGKPLITSSVKVPG